MLVHCLAVSPTTNLDVRTAAVKATAAFVLSQYEEKAIIKQLLDCVPLMIEFVAETILAEGEHCDQSLNSLVEIAEKCPTLLRHQFEPLIQLCIKALSEPEVPESRKHYALEIIISIAEAAPATMRKRGAPYLAQIVTQLLELMTEIEDDEDWSAADVIEEEDYDSNSVIGETSLDRLACSVGGKTILPLVINNVSTMLQNPDWHRRHAAMMAVSAVGKLSNFLRSLCAIW